MAQLQNKPSGCGPAAVCNAVQLYNGRVLDQEEVATKAKTDAGGTFPQGIVSALRWAGLSPVKLSVSDDLHAYLILRYYLERARPVILCVDAWEHWLVAGGILGGRVVLVDSADGGVVSAPEDFMKRWKYPGKTRKPFYGIAIDK